MQNRVQAVVSLGVGGSYLGGRVIFESLVDEYWNGLIGNRIAFSQFQTLFCRNSLSANGFAKFITGIITPSPSLCTLNIKNAISILLVTSKSGTTLECTAGFMSLYWHLLIGADVSNLEVAVLNSDFYVKPNPPKN